MPNIFEEIHKEQGSSGNVFDQIHAESKPTEAPPSNFQNFTQGLVGDTIDGLIGTVKNLGPKPLTSAPSEAREVVGDVQAGNYWEAAKKAARAAIEHLPGGQLATGMIDSSIDQAQKAHEAYQNGNIGEAILHGAAAIPVVGSMAASGIDTALGQDAKLDKFGKVIQEAVAPNPYRALGQATSLGIGLLAPKIVPKAVEAGTTALVDSGVPESLRDSAQKQYAQVLNPTTIGNKARTARVVPELINRGVTSLTLKGLRAKAAEGVASAGEALGNAYEGLPEGSSVPLKSLQDAISNSANEAFTVASDAKNAAGDPVGRISMSEVADAGIKHANDISNRLLEVAVKDAVTGDLVVPVNTARRLRQYYDSVAKQAGRYDAKQLSEASVAEAHGMAADAIREHLNNIDTGESTIGDLNKEYSFWKDVERVTSDTLNRRQGQAKPLGRKIAAAAGTAVGGATGGIKGAILGKQAMDWLETATSSPGWKTVSAVMKDRLANAIADGSTAKSSMIASQLKSAAASESRKLGFENTDGKWLDASGSEWTKAKVEDVLPDSAKPVEHKVGDTVQLKGVGPVVIKSIDPATGTFEH